MIYKFLCIILFIILLLNYKRDNKKVSYDDIDIIKSYNEIFYYKDLKNDIEFFKLNIGNKNYNSLYDFLRVFKNGNILLEKIKNKHNNFKINLESENNLHHLEAKLQYLKSGWLLISFKDYSDLYNQITALNKENIESKNKLDFHQEILNQLPVIIYANKDNYIIFNQLYYQNKDQIKHENVNAIKELQISDDVFELKYVSYESYNIIYGFNVAYLKRNIEELESYKERFKDLIDYTSDAIVIVDKKLNIIFKNKQYENFSKYYNKIANNIENITDITKVSLKRVQVDTNLTINLVLIPQQQNTIIIIHNK
jgi:hypothetical protein